MYVRCALYVCTLCPVRTLCTECTLCDCVLFLGSVCTFGTLCTVCAICTVRTYALYVPIGCTLKIIKYCKKNKIKTLLSARSGDTEEGYLSHLAVGWKTDMIKVGSFTRSDRTSKWNELVRIKEQLKVN